MAPVSTTEHALTPDDTKVFNAIDAQFQLDDACLHQITEEFLYDIQGGLSTYGRSMAMMYVQAYFHPSIHAHLRFHRPTFVTGVPNGTETG